MTIPSQTDMFGIVLGVMQDGKARSRKEIKSAVRETLGLSKEECAYKTDSGKPVYESRTGWGISYLSRARLVDRVSRGVYQVNDAGRQLYATGLTGAAMSHEISRIISEVDPWNIGGDSEGQEAENVDTLHVEEAPSSKSPQEQIEDLAAEMNNSLGDELLALIMDRQPAFFEKVVVDLLVKMGYGKGEVTSYSSDGGIDGLVTTDELGFRPIYTQAKRYAEDHKIGRPTLQSFVGALNGAQDGVFITTSSFTPEAVAYAKGYPGATIALIDGKRLVSLMIKYGLGVATESVVEIKRVDSDYFADE